MQSQTYFRSGSRMRNGGKSSSGLLLLVVLLPLAACRPPQYQVKEQEIRKSLAAIKSRLVTLVSEQFPLASEEERQELLRMLVRRMRRKIQRNVLQSAVTKEDILARMLR